MAAAKGELADIAHQAADVARKAGAQEVAARAARARSVDVEWRDGRLEKISEATTRNLGLGIYVDGRYSSVSTSDLRPAALAEFVRNAVAATRKLAADPHRRLPDPAWYKGRPAVDLQLEDARYAQVTPAWRRQQAQALEAGAREIPQAGRILSTTTSFWDTFSESFLVNSNGFAGERRDTLFAMAASVSMKDDDGRRPEEWTSVRARFVGELARPEAVGREAASRTASRLGSKKGASEVVPVVIDNRVAGTLIGHLGAALNGFSLQQKRSFLEGKQGQKVGSERLDLEDDPLLPKGLGSRAFDGEGITARRFPIFRAGVLQDFYLDSYYARKLSAAPTTGGHSNQRWKLGTSDRAGLVAQAGEGILITQFLGGNSNSTTGDFSLGIAGFRIRKGVVAEPVAEMNLSGNHLELWKRLAAVGNDPYPYAPTRTPSLLFDGVEIAGA